MAWNSTPAIQQQLCISPPIKGTFWGTSQTWDTASPQGKDTKGMLFTKRCCHFFSNDLGFNFKFPPKTYITHIIFAEKKNTVQGNHLSPSFHQIPGQESKPYKKNRKKKIAPRMMVIHWWWSSAASSLKPNIHSRLCKKWPQEFLKNNFSSPSWRSLNPLKGSLNHPKKVTLNHQAAIFFLFFFGGWGGQWRSWNMLQLGGRKKPFDSYGSFYGWSTYPPLPCQKWWVFLIAGFIFRESNGFS